jgi:precorrin-4/cobalt-precorrin-4 C11-methyltransferase
MREHPLYFIGAGPGHPRHLTREGAASLRNARFVYALDPYPSTFSRLLRGKEVCDPKGYTFSRLTARLRSQLAQAPVAFLVPGDLTVFSPFMSLVAAFSSRARVIPGVGVMNAAAALLHATLEQPPETKCVVLASPRHLPGGRRGRDMLLRMAALRGTMVLYMVDRPLREMAALLAGVRGKGCPAALVHRAGLPGERTWRGTLATLPGLVGEEDPLVPGPGKGASLALLLVGEALASRASAAEWDRRKRKVWDALDPS